MVNSKDLPDALHRLSEAHKNNPLSSTSQVGGQMKTFEIVIKIDVQAPDRLIAWKLGEEACNFLNKVPWAAKSNVSAVHEVEAEVK